MRSVHIFISNGRFRSFSGMREFIDQRYTEDGDGIPSEFMREAGLRNYEPMCIEAVISSAGSEMPVNELLTNASWSSQWLEKLPPEKRADAAICVFDPNTLQTPEATSLEYLGAFPYDAA
jgi:hypothetical protein